MTDLTVDSPPPTPMRTPTPVQTPEHIREERRKRQCEWKFKNFFRPAPLDDKKADEEFEKTVKPSRFEMA